MINNTSNQDSVRAPAAKRRKVVLFFAATSLILAIFVFTGLKMYAALSVDIAIAQDEVRIANVVRGDLIREVSAPGKIVVANSPTLFSPEQGIIKLYVKAGDTVTNGQLLADITSPELNELLAREKAELTRLQLTLSQQKVESQQLKLQRQQALSLAKVSLEASQREMRRANQSQQLKLISQIDFEAAQDNLKRAELEYQQAQQNLELSEDALAFYAQALRQQTQSQALIIKALERRVDDLKIVSPVNGMIGTLEVNQHQLVSANQALISTVDLSTFEIESRVAEGLAADIRPGMGARVSMTGKTHSATVTAISPEVVNGEVTVRLAFNRRPATQLRQNQRLSTHIQLENKPDILMVKRGPFFDGFTGNVFKVQGDRAHATQIEIGTSSLKDIEIINGLTEGDRIIVSRIEARPNQTQILLTQ